jgi:hypothetical protein
VKDVAPSELIEAHHKPFTAARFADSLGNLLVDNTPAIEYSSGAML